MIMISPRSGRAVHSFALQQEGHGFDSGDVFFSCMDHVHVIYFRDCFHVKK